MPLSNKEMHRKIRACENPTEQIESQNYLDVSESYSRRNLSWDSDSYWAEQFWAKQIWASKIKERKDVPSKRLVSAIEDLPGPAAFREAAVALRAIIRLKKKTNQSVKQELAFLYKLAAVQSFMLPFAFELQEPGINVMLSAPGHRIMSLEYDFPTLGYLKLSLLNRTDIKWLVSVFGEPDEHVTLNFIHRDVWKEYESKLLDDRVARFGGTRRKLLQHAIHGEDVSKKAAMPASSFEKWRYEVLGEPLEIQCKSLGIQYEELSGLDYKGKPEITAWEYFCSRGLVGGYCEGGPILLLIRAAALDILTKLNTFDSRSDACSRFTEAQLFGKKSTEITKIVEHIRKIEIKQVIENFNELYNGSGRNNEYYPGLTEISMNAILCSLGTECLARIANAFSEDPYELRNGWPDLIMTDGSKMHWIEIKTTDKLHQSQIALISRMKSILPGDIRVCKLI